MIQQLDSSALSKSILYIWKLVLVLLKPSLKDFEWNLIAELPQDWETETLGGHKQNPVHTRTQEKGAVTPQETEPDLPVSVWESLAEAWVDSGSTALGGVYCIILPLMIKLETKGCVQTKLARQGAGIG